VLVVVLTPDGHVSWRDRCR